MNEKWKLKNSAEFPATLIFEPTEALENQVSETVNKLVLMLAKREEQMIFAHFSDDQLKRIISRASKELSERIHERKAKP